MRTGLALLLSLALAVTPAVAQGKTKSSPVQEAVAALGVCEAFAKGDVLAVEGATEAGWDAYEDSSESPFIRTYSASREIPGIGWGDIFVLVENYPDQTLGYCRVDVVGPTGNGEAVIGALSRLDRFTGEVKSEGGGTYASLSGTGDDHALLMTHWDETGFVIQLTIITPKTAQAEQ
jgi:hypothetical protein